MAWRDDGYTDGMKTAISLPDDLFAASERFRARVNKSRSELFADAVREYLQRHDEDEITEQINRVIDELEAPADQFVARAAYLTLSRVEW